MGPIGFRRWTWGDRADDVQRRPRCPAGAAARDLWTCEGLRLFSRSVGDVLPYADSAQAPLVCSMASALTDACYLNRTRRTAICQDPTHTPDDGRAMGQPRAPRRGCIAGSHRAIIALPVGTSVYPQREACDGPACLRLSEVQDQAHRTRWCGTPALSQVQNHPHRAQRTARTRRAASTHTCAAARTRTTGDGTRRPTASRAQAAGASARRPSTGGPRSAAPRTGCRKQASRP